MQNRAAEVSEAEAKVKRRREAQQQVRRTEALYEEDRRKVKRSRAWLSPTFKLSLELDELAHQRNYKQYQADQKAKTMEDEYMDDQEKFYGTNLDEVEEVMSPRQVPRVASKVPSYAEPDDDEDESEINRLGAYGDQGYGYGDENEDDDDVGFQFDPQDTSRFIKKENESSFVPPDPSESSTSKRDSEPLSRKPAYQNIYKLLKQKTIPSTADVERYHREIGCELEQRLITRWNEAIVEKNDYIKAFNKAKKKGKKPLLSDYRPKGTAGKRLTFSMGSFVEDNQYNSMSGKQKDSIEDTRDFGSGDSSGKLIKNASISCDKSEVPKSETANMSSVDSAKRINWKAEAERQRRAAEASKQRADEFEKTSQVSFAAGFQATGVANCLLHDFDDLQRAMEIAPTPVIDPGVIDVLARMKSRNHDEDMQLPRKTFGTDKYDDRPFTIFPTDKIDSRRMKEICAQHHRYAFQDDGREIKHNTFRGRDEAIRKISYHDQLKELKVGDLPGQVELRFEEARLAQMGLTPEEMIIIKKYRLTKQPGIPSEAPPPGFLDYVMKFPLAKTKVDWGTVNTWSEDATLEALSTSQEAIQPADSWDHSHDDVILEYDSTGMPIAKPISKAFDAVQLCSLDPAPALPNWEEQQNLIDRAEEKWKSDRVRFDSWTTANKKFPKNVKLLSLQPPEPNNGWHCLMSDNGVIPLVSARESQLDRYLQHLNNCEMKGQIPDDEGKDFSDMVSVSSHQQPSTSVAAEPSSGGGDVPKTLPASAGASPLAPLEVASSSSRVSSVLSGRSPTVGTASSSAIFGMTSAAAKTSSPAIFGTPSLSAPQVSSFGTSSPAVIGTPSLGTPQISSFGNSKTAGQFHIPASSASGQWRANSYIEMASPSHSQYEFVPPNAYQPDSSYYPQHYGGFDQYVDRMTPAPQRNQPLPHPPNSFMAPRSGSAQERASSPYPPQQHHAMQDYTYGQQQHTLQNNSNARPSPHAFNNGGSPQFQRPSTPFYVQTNFSRDHINSSPSQHQQNLYHPPQGEGPPPPKRQRMKESASDEYLA